MKNLIFNCVSGENLAMLKTFLQQNGCEGFDENSGTVQGRCLGFDFKYEPSSHTLELVPKSLPKNLASLPEDIGHAAAYTMLSNVMGLEGANRPMTEMLTASTYPSPPSRYGVYDYVIPFITNTTGEAFHFSSQTMAHGTIFSNVETVAANALVIELFEADSAKLSGYGVGGRIVYQWADNATDVNIDFFLNTIFTHTFTVGFSGPNAANMVGVITENSPVLSGYTYLDPKITISNVA